MSTRKFVATGVGLVTALLLSACGGSGEGAGGEKIELALIQGVKSEPFYISMACGARQQAEQMGVELSVQAPNQWDVQQQTQVVNAVAAKQPDGVLIAPVHETSMIAPVRQLADSGATVTLVDTGLKESSFALTHISSNNKKGGRAAATAMAELIGDKGTVLVVSVTPGTPTTDARAEGFTAEMKQNHPEIEVLPVEYAGDNAAKAAQIVQATLSAHPNLAGVFAANLVTGQGAGTGLRNSGKVGDVKLVEFDASPTQVEDLKKGVAQALIAQEPLKIGKLGVKKTVAAIKGGAGATGSGPESISTGVVTVTKDNLDDPEISKFLYKKSC